ncbi:MAG: hypothetical protein U9R47_09925 [Actinomycetota bacterium]|nr:hypothetical protein [Actinomycetota bacterium]
MRRAIAILVSAVMLTTGACATDDPPDNDTSTTVEVPTTDLNTVPSDDGEG